MIQLLSHGIADLALASGMVVGHATHLGHNTMHVLDIAADVWGAVADDAREILFTAFFEN
ncbi:MAG: hypothetical protein DCF32_14430 [Leptolyngbya sp.]|nr:MAG: hypothetical protein DCF32_14430 [Leptolyngbya sp.]